jgi:hypothetical protein
MWSLIKHTEAKGMLESKFFKQLEILSNHTIATTASEFVDYFNRMLHEDVQWVHGLYAGDVFKAQVINHSCVVVWRYTIKGQKSYKMATLSFAVWQVESVDRYWFASGRNYDTYKEVTFWFNPLSLERRETVRQVTISYRDVYSLPEWARSITQHRKSLDC